MGLIAILELKHNLNLVLCYTLSQYFVSQPAHPMSVNLACAPVNVPPQFEENLQLLHKQTRTLFDFKMVPYFIQAQLAEGKYFSVEDVADRWNTPEEARQLGPAELKFQDGEND